MQDLVSRAVWNRIDSDDSVSKSEMSIQFDVVVFAGS